MIPSFFFFVLQGGVVCSVGNGKVAVVSVQANRDNPDELKLKVVDIIRLPLRNATSAGEKIPKSLSNNYVHSVIYEE